MGFQMGLAPEIGKSPSELVEIFLANCSNQMRYRRWEEKNSFS
jgi:hypothetical protein